VIHLRRVVAAACCLMVAAVIAACSTQSATRVNVAAAADLRYALDEIISIAAARNPSVDYAVTYGSSGQFLQQIDNGAPFDIYLSADVTYPQQLIARGKASDPFVYAVGRLVLWVPEGSPIDPAQGLAALSQAQRIAIANPEHAPYGQAAVAALRAEGIYDSVAPRLVLGENVAQAAEFVASGNADAGIVAMSLVLSDPLRDVGTWWEIPAQLFPPLVQGGALITDTPGTRELRDVITSPEGIEILARYGFTLPEE